MSSPGPSRHARIHLVIVLLVLSALFFVTFIRVQTTALAATSFVVTNTDDSGAGSLRQAMLDANANPGLDTITFNIGSGIKTIKPLSRLPSLTDPVTIDGSTQPGFSGSPIIEIDSSNLAEGVGLHLVAGDSTVRSLVINRSYFDGIAMSSKGGNRVEGCYIGTDVTGTFAKPNRGNGISSSGSNNVIGGTTAATRNVISGNGSDGIDISRACCTGDLSSITGNVIQGNYIGVNATGSAAIVNQGNGIDINSFNANVPMTGNLIGGTQPGTGNVVSGNHGYGVILDGFHVQNNTVQGNFIGTDVTGSFAIPNDRTGVIVTGSSNLIGGTVPGARNVISGNGCMGTGCTDNANGLGLGGPGNIAKGNIIGVSAALTTPLPNTGYGVAFGGANSIIGGTNPGEPNVIAFNNSAGILNNNPTSTGNTFRGNSIFSNGFFFQGSGAGLGIDIGTFGVTPNDVGDGDTGTNNLQNFPVITSVTVGAGSVNVKGTLNSTASTSFNLDFFGNSVCDPLGYGEGARLIGSAALATNASGDATFDLNFPVTLSPGQVLTATATDPAGNTSEFSQCSAPTSPLSGSINFEPNSLTVSEAAGVASFSLTRTGGSAGSLTINFSVVGQTATAGADFTATQGSFTFADGETSKMFTVPILEDALDEPSEIAKVTLSTSGPLDTLGSQSTATLTITDNDPLVTVRITDVSVNEGNSGTTTAFFTFYLSAVSAKVVTVGYVTADDSASAPSDYVPISPTEITFNPGETSKTVGIKVNGDTVVESDETFFVNIIGFINGNIIDNQGIGTILNDDGATVPLQLMLDENGPSPVQVAALDDMLFLRDPFQIVSSANLLNPGPDRNTRIVVFVMNLALAQGEPSSAVVVNLVDSSQQSYDLMAEDVRPTPDFSFAQVIFRLPDNLAPGICSIKVKAHGLSSNSGTFRIKP